VLVSLTTGRVAGLGFPVALVLAWAYLIRLRSILIENRYAWLFSTLTGVEVPDLASKRLFTSLDFQRNEGLEAANSGQKYLRFWSCTAGKL